MKKSSKIVVSVVCVILVVVIGSVTLLIGENHIPQNDMKLFGDYYMYRKSNTNSILYQKIDDSQKHNLLQGWVYKFSFDKGKKVIAMRYMVAYKLKDVSGEVPNVLYNRFYAGEEYLVVEDGFKLYNCKKDEFIDFENNASLLNYCNENNIKLKTWYYPGGDGYYQSTKTVLWKYEDFEDVYHETSAYDYSTIVFSENDEYFGIITDIEVSEYCISFRLRQTKEYSPENMYANESLSPMSEEPIGKYKGKDVYYDQIINHGSGHVEQVDP